MFTLHLVLQFSDLQDNTGEERTVFLLHRVKEIV